MFKHIRFLMVLCMVPIALAAEPFQRGEARVTASVLNVRNIASSGGNVVGTVRRGDIVQVVDRSVNEATIEDLTDHWYKISIPGKKIQTGWVFGGYLTFEVNMEAGLRFRSLQPASETYTGVAFFSTGDAILGTDSGVLYITSDRGRNFRKIVPQALGNKMGGVKRIVAFGKDIWIAAAGGKRGGVWKTSNNGTSWTQFTTAQGLSSNDINDIARSEDGSIWAATGAGISVSHNNGARWESYGPADNANAFTAIAVSSSKGSYTVLAGSGHGLYSTAAESGFFGGKETVWKRLGENENRINTLAISPDSSVYIGTNKGLFKTSLTDLNHWNAIGGETNVHHIALDEQSNRQPRVSVGTSNGLNISLDQGVSWATYKKEHGLAGNQVFEIAIHPRDHSIWTASGDSGVSLHD